MNFRSFFSQQPQQNVAAPPAPTQTKPNPENQTENQVEDFGDLWNDKPQVKDSNPSLPVNNNNTAKDPAEAFQEYMNNLSFIDDRDMKELQEHMNLPEGTDLSKLFNTAMRKVYQKALMDANQIVNDKVQEAVDQAVNKSSGRYQADLLRRDMSEALPYTEDPNIAPIAEFAVGRFMKAGASREDALRKTDKFLRSVGEKVTKSSSNGRGESLPGRGNFGKQNFFEDDGDNPDWSTILGSP